MQQSQSTRTDDTPIWGDWLDDIVEPASLDDLLIKGLRPHHVTLLIVIQGRGRAHRPNWPTIAHVAAVMKETPETIQQWLDDLCGADLARRKLVRDWEDNVLVAAYDMGPYLNAARRSIALHGLQEW